MLSRVQGRIVHKRLDRISPLAVPAMLQIGRETVGGEASEDVLREAAEDLVREAMGDDADVGRRYAARTVRGRSGRRSTAEADSTLAMATSLGSRSATKCALDNGAPALIGVAGVVLEAFADGALWWADRRMLVVADLHLEKGSSYARRGQLLPPYDTAETLARLARLVTRLDPAVVVALGDSFHDGEGAARLSARDGDALRALQRGRDFVWIAGNHDPGPPARARRHPLRHARGRADHLPPRAACRRGGRDRRAPPPVRPRRRTRQVGAAEMLRR